MKPQRNILIAFILNLSFAIFEFFGGIVTGSVAIVSDAIHDVGDAASIGLSYFLEKKSRKQPDSIYTYGYGRYSVLGGLITTVILLFGSVAVIYNAIYRIITPSDINYNGMILFAVIGVCVNVCAALFTRDGHSLNQKAVNLHMLEDVLGWGVVLIGAIVMRFTDCVLIDPIMSIGVALFILYNAAPNLKEVADLFLVRTPRHLDAAHIKKLLEGIDGVLDIHHIHLWSMDGQSHYTTLHAVTDSASHKIKHAIREEMAKHGIRHVTIELEGPLEHCHEIHCHVKPPSHSGHHHHHH